MKIQDQNVEDVLDDVRARFNNDFVHFSDCLRVAFGAVEAVFWKPQYYDFYWHCVTRVPGYIQRVVLANADAESDGSRKLAELWSSIHDNKHVSGHLKKHLNDESRHARLFVRLANLSFPLSVPKDVAEVHRARLFDSSRAMPERREIAISETDLIDNLIQTNIGEIRTRAHMFMIGPVLTAFAPTENKETVDGILSGLVSDEVAHIGYTADLMEQWCRNGQKELVKQIYLQRLRDFNQFTVNQTKRSVELYGDGKFPELFEI